MVCVYDRNRNGGLSRVEELATSAEVKYRFLENLDRRTHSLGNLRLHVLLLVSSFPCCLRSTRPSNGLQGSIDGGQLTAPSPSAGPTPSPSAPAPRLRQVQDVSLAHRTPGRPRHPASVGPTPSTSSVRFSGSTDNIPRSYARCQPASNPESRSAPNQRYALLNGEALASFKSTTWLIVDRKTLLQ